MTSYIADGWFDPLSEGLREGAGRERRRKRKFERERGERGGGREREQIKKGTGAMHYKIKKMFKPGD